MPSCTKLILAILLLVAPGVRAQQQKPSLSEVDRIRLAETFRIGKLLGNSVWTAWDKAPFAVLLVTPENEFLIRHPQPSEDFKLIGYDSLLQSKVYYRHRTQPLNLLATFPAVGMISTIVVGQAENTDQKSSTPWVVILLHEHFHQLQDSQPNFYAAVNALNLSHSDQSGMWMLNYPFPYRSARVMEQFNALCRSLADTLQTTNRRDLSTKLARYLEARRKFESQLTTDDYKYFSFQLWKEGVARYTEYRIAQAAVRRYRPSKRFRALPDYQPFKVVADALLKRIIRQLSTLQLGEAQRSAFYPFGAGEALLLDRVKPRWQNHYFTDKSFLEKYYR